MDRATATVLAKKPVVLTEREATKPIGLRADTGEFVRLVDWVRSPKMKFVPFAALDQAKQAKLTIERLKLEPKDMTVGGIGGDTLTRDEIIEEVKKCSATGREFVDIQRIWIERLTEKVSKGEYQLSGQTSTNAG